MRRIGRSIEYTLSKESVYVRPLNLKDIDFILGLSFLLKDNSIITITKKILYLQKDTLFTPTYITHLLSKYIEKRDEKEKENSCKIERECQLIKEGFEEFENIGFEGLENIELEYGNVEFIDNERIYDILVIEQEIENLISKLEIIGENVLKYWEKKQNFM